MYRERVELANGLLIIGDEALEYLGLKEFGDRYKAAMPDENANGVQEEAHSIIMKKINKDPDLIRIVLEFSKKNKIRMSNMPEQILHLLWVNAPTEVTKTLRRRIGSYWDLIYDAWYNLFISGRIGPERFAIPVYVNGGYYGMEAYPCDIDSANAVWVPYQVTLKQIRNLPRSERFSACEKIAKNDLLEYETMINEELESEWVQEEVEEEIENEEWEEKEMEVE